MNYFYQLKRVTSLILSVALMLSFIPLNVYAQVRTKVAAISDSDDYTQFVDPFVGTDVDYGQLFPGSVVPYGLMKLSPDTYPHDTLDHSGYDYSKSMIQGFSHTRIEGVGGQGAGGDILITPTYVQYDSKPGQASRAMTIMTDNAGNKVEAAAPGYYTVSLWPKTGYNDNTQEDRSGAIKAELTSNTHTGYHRYTLPKDGEISLSVDLGYTYQGPRSGVVMHTQKLSDKVVISGQFSAGNVGGNGKYTMYFYMETNQPALEVSAWNGSDFETLGGEDAQTGSDLGAVLTFIGRKDTPLEVKVTVSPISAEQAQRDMEAELSGWDFDAERAQAKETWNNVLSKVKVTSSTTSDPDGRLKKLFYTHLYHMFTMPMNATSTDGTYRAINATNDIEIADGYIHYDSWTLWDDFKKYPIRVTDQSDGTFDQTIMATLSGSTQFAGAVGEDFVSTGKLCAADLPEGMVLTAQKKDDTTLELHFSGSITGVYTDRDGLILTYTDEAFTNTSAQSIVGSNYGGMKAIKIISTAKQVENQQQVLRSSIHTLLDRVDKLDLSQYASASVQVLDEAKGVAQTALDDTQVTMEQLQSAYDALNSALNNLFAIRVAGRIELESYDQWNTDNNPDKNSPLKTEQSKDSDEGTSKTDVVANTFDGAWLRFAAVDFGTEAPERISVRYAGSSGCFEDSYVELRLDSVDGELIATVQTPPTGAWDKYTTATAELTDAAKAKLTGVQDLYLVMKGTRESGKTYAGNFNWVEFGIAVRDGLEKIELESYDQWNTDNNPDNNNPLKTEQSNDSDEGTAKTNVVANTYDGAWLKFARVDFGTQVPDAVAIRYTGKNNCYADAYVEVRLGSETGEVIATVQTPPTGGWDKYATATAELTDTAKAKLTGVQDLYLVMKGTRQSGQTYVGNFNWMQFSARTAHDASRLEAESFDEKTTALHANGTGVKIEDGGVGGSIANTFDQAWVRFDRVNFGASGPNKVTINYKAKAGACPEDARLEIRQGDPETGTLLVSIAAPASGSSGWMNWTQVTAELTADQQANLKGTMDDVYLVFRGDMSSDSSWYIMNLDYVSFAREDIPQGLSAYDKLELEEHTLGGEGLGAESADDGQMINNVNIGEWLGFQSVDFGASAPEAITVRYSGSYDCYPDAGVELYLGSSPETGTLIGKIATPPTASWSEVTQVRVALEETTRQLLVGKQDICLRFVGTAQSDCQWVGNYNWVRFEQQLTTEKSYGLVEAEERDQDSGNLNIEGGTVVHGTYDGAWLAYQKCSFDGKGLGEITLRYANNASRMGDNSAVEVYIDDMEKQTPDLTIALPVTATGSYVFQTIRAKLDTPVTGEHTVYLVLKSDTSTSRPYAAKLDWMIFTQSNEDLQQLRDIMAFMQQAKQKEDVQADMENLYWPLRTALLKAERVSAAVVPDSVEILDALNALEALEKPIVSALVQGELARLITACGALTEQTTDQESLETIAQAIAQAQTVTVDSGFGEYQSAFTELRSAYDNRKPVLEKQALAELLGQAQEALGDTQSYIESSKEDLAAAAALAEQVLNDTDATPQAIEDAVTQLRAGLEKLLPVASKASLQSAVDRAKEAFNTGEFTSQSGVLLLDGIREAEQMIKDAQSSAAPPTMEEYALAVKKLDDLVERVLTDWPAESMAELSALVDELSALDLSHYTAASGAAVTYALEQAEALGDTPAVADITLVLNLLKKAKNSLEPDRSDLLEAITSAQAKLQHEDLYTAASVQALQDALSQAQLTYDDATATVETLMEHVRLLRTAIEGLTSTTSGGSHGGGGSSSSTADQSETQKNPDGSTLTTTTKADGTVIETVKYPDGTQSQTTTKPNGTVTYTATGADGVKVEATIGATGKTIATVTVSEKAIASGVVPIEILIPAISAEQGAVISFKVPSGKTVQVELPVAAVTPGTVAMLVLADGSEKIIASAVPTENALVVFVQDGTTLRIHDNSVVFTDVRRDSWAYNSIQFSASRGLLAGTGETTFAPDGLMTRAMAMTVLARLDGQDTGGGSTWYEAGMNWAKEQGISDGSGSEVKVISGDSETGVKRINLYEKLGASALGYHQINIMPAVTGTGGAATYGGMSILQGADSDMNRMYAASYENKWRPDYLTFSATYDSGMTLFGYDYFYSDDTVVREITANDQGELHIAGRVGDDAAVTADSVTSTFTERNNGACRIGLGFSQEPVSITYYDNYQDLRNQVDPKSTPVQGGVFYADFSNVKDDTLYVTCGVANAASNASSVVPEAPTAAQISGARAAATTRADELYAKIPVAQFSELEDVDDKGVTAQQQRQSYYKAWSLIDSCLIPENSENGFEHVSFAASKGHMWHDAHPQSLYAAAWETFYAIALYAYVDVDVAWDAFLGQMKLVDADGALGGEGLPVTRARTAMILYGNTSEGEGVENLLACYENIDKNLRWAFENPHWVDANYTGGPNQKDSDFLVAALTDLPYMQEIYAILSQSGKLDKATADAKIAELEELRQQQYSNYAAWMFKNGEAYGKVDVDTSGNRSNFQAGNDQMVLKGLHTPGLQTSEYTVLMNRFSSVFSKDKDFGNFDRSKYEEFAYMVYGLYETGNYDEANQLVDGSIRDAVLAHTMGEVFATGDSSSLKNRPSRTLLAGNPWVDGVQPSIFGAAQIIDSVWMKNGLRYDESGMHVYNYGREGGGVTNLRSGDQVYGYTLTENGGVEITCGGQVSGTVTLSKGAYVPLTDPNTVLDPETPPQQEDIATYSTTWRYLDDGTDPAAGKSERTSWTYSGYDDSTWKQAKGSFGAKNGGIADLGDGCVPSTLLTQYKTGSNTDIEAYFFRTTVAVEDPTKIAAITGSLRYDDAAIVYINGTRLAAFDEPEGGFDQNLAYGGSNDGTPKLAQISVTDPETISQLLVAGENTVAVELHQGRSSSSDIYLDVIQLRFSKEYQATQDSISIAPGSDETQMNFTWYTDSAKAGTIYWAKQSEVVGGKLPETAKQQQAVSNLANRSGSYYNQVTITDLEPGTAYAYQVVNGGTASKVYELKTQSHNEGFQFLLVGDPQLGASGDLGGDRERWDETLNTAMAMVPDAAFLLSVGDQVNTANDEGQYSSYLDHDVLQRLPAATVVGNHDTASSSYDQHFNVANQSGYGKTAASSDYWFRYGDALFMMLNVNNLSTAEHATFIKEAKAANPDAKWKIVAMHHSVYSVANHAVEDDILQRRIELVPLFQQEDIDVVLQGHDHVYVRSYIMDNLTPVTDPGRYDDETMASVTDPEGVLYMTANSASGSKYYNIKGDVSFPYAAVKVQGYQRTYAKVSVSDTQFAITTYRVDDGAVVDEFSIHRTVKLSSIAVTSQPDKTSYTAGEYFDPSGMVVTATYSDDSAKVVTDYTVEPSGALSTNVTSVAVWYEGKSAKVSIGVTSGGSSSGSSGSSAGTGNKTKTETTPDGTTITTVTKADGTVVETATDKNGNKSVTQTKPDGSVQYQATTTDGIVAKMETATDGQITVSVTIPQTAVKDGGTPIKLPIPEITAETKRDKAPVITVSAPENNPIKIEVPVSEMKPGIVAVMVGEDGIETILMTAIPGESGLIIPVEGKATVKIVDNSKFFVDVSESHWAYDSIQFTAAREIFSGVGENHFAPTGYMTRAMTMTVLARIDGQDTSGGSVWYEAGMNWARANGVSDGSAPEANISREQLVAMLYRYAGEPTVAETELEGFSDGANISPYAVSAMKWAVDCGILAGKNGGLDPTGHATRAEVSAMIQRFLMR